MTAAHRTPMNGDIAWRNGEPYVMFLFDADDCEAVAASLPSEDLFDADDCEAVAASLPSEDGWAHDLLHSAQQLRELAVSTGGAA